MYKKGLCACLCKNVLLMVSDVSLFGFYAFLTCCYVVTVVGHWFQWVKADISIKRHDILICTSMQVYGMFFQK